MDAVEFLKAKTRMCKGRLCDQCELWKSEIEPANVFCYEWMGKNAEKAVAFVEKWDAEHPIKTRQSEFLKMFPGADVGMDGCLLLNPCHFYQKMQWECSGRKCSDCRKVFWLAEVE